MKKNNFDQKINREDHHERRWNKAYIQEHYQVQNLDLILDSSIADLDFATPKPIVTAINERAQKPTYSYSFLENESLTSICQWYQELHQITLKPDWIKLVHGTVSAMHQVVQAFTNQGDGVLIQTPVYAPFARSILHNDRKVIANPLIYDQNQQTYQIDFQDFEAKIKENKIKLFMFCNPHNPGGVRWDEEVILKLIKICEKYQVLIFSDEVHGDLLLNQSHCSLLNFRVKKDYFIIANSPNKLFNLGGLKGSYLICKNKKIRTIIDQQYEKNSLTSLNVFFQPALIAAYSAKENLKWVKEFKDYVWQNYLYLKEELAKNLPNLEVFQMDASYLVWIKISQQKFNFKKFTQQLMKNNLIIGLAQEFYGAEENHFRLNIACPRSEVQQLITRLIKVFQK